MSLRYRLFLWITVTFLTAGCVNYFLENFTTGKELSLAQQRLKQKILQESKEKRDHIERFLTMAISENQAVIDVLLNRLTNYFLQVEHFAPIRANTVRGTWGEAAAILANNKWVDYIQNTIEGNVVSCIVPRPASLDNSYCIPIDENMGWVVMSDELEKKMPLIGVRIPIEYKPDYEQLESEQILLRKSPIPQGYILFDILDILRPPEKSLDDPVFQEHFSAKMDPLIVPWSEGYRININSFVQSFAKMRAYLQEGLGHLDNLEHSQIQQWVESQIESKGENLSSIRIEPLGYSKLSSKFMQQRLDEIAVQYHQVYMTWTLTAFFDTGLFGDDIFLPPAPKGVSTNKVGQHDGLGLHLVDVCYPNAFLDDANYFQANHRPDSQSNLGNSVAVFQGPDQYVYLGNSAQLLALDDNQRKVGYLSVAINGDRMLQKLVETMGQTAMIVHDGKIFGGYCADGQRMDLQNQTELPLKQMLSQNVGVVKWNNEDYFFSHMVPFSAVDLHFIIFNPVAVEFAFTKFLVDGAVHVVDSILFNVHIIGFVMMLLVLILLHNISKRITRPITQLAQATKDIGKGHLEGVKIPHPNKKNRGDEVATLCNAFEEMVDGLKEKEKVQAVLNKVVSQEIAHEILKGNIHLGGEEKKVTVLFADIRNFTHMTQNMQPAAVIDFLNMCMTKISNIIDKNTGVIDKYVGDATMALFGAPVPNEESAVKAIRSALEMLAEIKRWNGERSTQGLPVLEMGIGIHTGMVLAGNMGAENRLNYTVIGRNVNLASRLCSSAQGMEIRISADTWNEPGVKETFTAESIGPTILKGFDHPIEVFRVLDIRKQPEKTRI